MPRRLAQQRRTMSDLEWPFHASGANCAVAELLAILALIFVIEIRLLAVTVSSYGWLMTFYGWLAMAYNNGSLGRAV